jgi:thiol-disulfide isomerase/thioredoxin
MSARGHYWCDACDDVAFGSICQQCHRPARFIADAPARPRKPAPVSEAVAKEYFRKIHEVIDQNGH